MKHAAVKASIILTEGETFGGGRSKRIDVKVLYIAENMKRSVMSGFQVLSVPRRCRSFIYLLQNCDVQAPRCSISTAWNCADLMTEPLGERFDSILDFCTALLRCVRTTDSGEKPDNQQGRGGVQLHLGF